MSEYKRFPEAVACSKNLKVKWLVGDVSLVRSDDPEQSLDLDGWAFENRGDFCVLNFTVPEKERESAWGWVDSLGMIGHKTDVEFRFRDLRHVLFRPILIEVAGGYRLCFLESPAEVITSGEAAKLFV